MKKLRVALILVILALGGAVPVVSALMPAHETHPGIVRIADDPTPTPTPNSSQGPGGCQGAGC